MRCGNESVSGVRIREDDECGWKTFGPTCGWQGSSPAAW